jgi:hypothetical protein
VEDGRKELAAVEPRIPKLRVMTEPQVLNAGLRIDGADVSSAAVGIPRPINPGKHRVELATPGQPWSAADVDVAEATTRDVVFRVQSGAAAAPKVTTGVVAVDATASGEPAPGTAGAPPKDEPFVGFLGGLRLGAAIPTGTVFHFTPENFPDAARDVEMSEVVKPGAAIEFHAGIRLGRYFTPIFFLAGQGLAHPDKFNFSPAAGALTEQKVTSANAGTFGIGVLIGTPPGRIGAFGEFGIGLIDVLSVEFENAGGSACKIDARGASLRLGGGAIIPTVKWLQITPVAHVSLGQFTNTSSTGCGENAPSRDLPAADQRTHGMVFLGVGGDVVIGGRR